MPSWLGTVAFGLAFAGFISSFLFRAYIVGVVLMVLGAIAGLLILIG